MNSLVSIGLLVAVLISGLAEAEDAHNAAFCADIGGETETRHYYDYPTGRSYVRVDCIAV